MPVLHNFVNPIADEPGFLGTKPSDWNDVHSVSIVDADVDAAAGIVESKLSLNFPTHAEVTLGTASGLSLVGQVLSLGLASVGVTGALSGADWSTFNSKQSALTFPLAADLGGTGIANGAGSTLTLGAATSITGGGTIALGGFTLTVPATGTAALLATANVFTGENLFTLGRDSTNVFIGDEVGNTTLTGIKNVAIGAGALTSNTTGHQNVALGYFALFNNTEGYQNFALGSESLNHNTIGHDNVAVGIQSQNANTEGSYNTAVGYYSLRANTKGTLNTAIGALALSVYNRTDGQGENVAIGDNAGGSTTNGIKNVFVGRAAGFFNQTGAGNIYLGFQAGFYETGSNKLYIDNSSRTSEAVARETAFLYGEMATGGRLQLNISTTTNNAPKDTLKLQAYVSTASTGAANGFGVGLPFYAETATDATYQQQGLISTSWIDATNASRKAKMSLSAYDTAARLGIEIEASGTAPMLGFYGVVPVIRATNAIAAGAFVANTSGIVNDTATFGGYTIGQIVQALQNIGILT